MAYSQTDLDNLETAIRRLAAGSRRIRITIGGDTIEYAQADLDKLRALRSEMQCRTGTPLSF